MPISVSVNTRELEAAFAEIKKRLPTVTARAMNETAAWARKNAEKDAARELDLPLKLVRKRLTVDGEVKEDRAKIRKANRSNLTTTLDVYVRGIPVGQIALKPTKRQNKRPGVKAKGGRLYRGAFYSPGAVPHGFVFKRRRSGRLMVPKVGVREILNRFFELYLTGPAFIAEFRRRWNRLASFELEKISRTTGGGNGPGQTSKFRNRFRRGQG